MNFTRYTYQVFIACFGMLTCIGLIVYLVDPYGEFNHPLWKMRTFKSTPLVTLSLSASLREGPYSLVFGTSHSAIIQPKYFNGKALNFHALYGNPRSVADFLDSLDPRQINNIREIFYLLDIHVYGSNTYRPFDSYGNVFRRFLYRARRIGPYVAASTEKIYKNFAGTYDAYIDPHGHTVVLAEKDLCHIPVRRDPLSVEEIDEKAIAALSRIRAFGKLHNINMTFVTPAMLPAFLDSLDKEKLWDQKQTLFSVLGEYHDFVFYGHSLANCGFFKDPRHLNVKGIDQFMKLVRAGVYLTSIPRQIEPPIGGK